MSRDQKPGKFKLVGSATATPARRASDKVAHAPVAGSLTHIAAAEGRPPLSRWVIVLLFLLTSAAGGTGAVFFGLVDGLPQ